MGYATAFTRFNGCHISPHCLHVSFLDKAQHKAYFQNALKSMSRYPIAGQLTDPLAGFRGPLCEELKKRNGGKETKPKKKGCALVVGEDGAIVVGG